MGPLGEQLAVLVEAVLQDLPEEALVPQVQAVQRAEPIQLVDNRAVQVLDQ